MLSNEFLSVDISPKGAELQSIFHRKHQLEYLWNADPAFWAKHSPVLFPIVGTLKNNEYSYDGKSYTLGRHGFARDKMFSIESLTKEKVIFLLTDDADTRKVYPFAFAFRVSYALEGEQLVCTYDISNTGETELLFSVGGHPAFKLPLTPDTDFSDYYLRFGQTENLSRWPISADGLIEQQPVPLLNNTDRLNLVKPLFYQDALVFKHTASDAVSILSGKSPHGLHFHYPDFPFLGIWSAKDANFLCIEPWCGIADSVTANGKLEDKEGIQRLEKGQRFTRTWNAGFF